MNDCCKIPSDKNSENKHKANEQCCSVADISKAPERAECPISKTISKKIQHKTLKHLLKPEKVSEIKNVQYYYCIDSDCKVVYFSNENVPQFFVEDLSVKVLTKDVANNVNVCYCFDWTRARIKEEISKTGKSTASIQITKEVKNGNCACDIKNPKGECCLGDVNSFVKSLTTKTKI